MSKPVRLLAALCALIVATVVWGFLRDDLLERVMKRAAPGASDCGRVRVGGDARPASECAMSAFQERKAFRVRFDMGGIDSTIAVGIAGTREGTVTAYMFDGDPEGHGGTLFGGQRVREYPCPTPVTLFLSKSGRLNCFPPDPNAERNIMSPTFENY